MQFEDDAEPQVVTETRKWAVTVLQAALAGELERAGHALDQLSALDEAFNGEAVCFAIVIWTDALKEHMLAGSYPSVKVYADTGSQIQVDDGRSYVLGTAEADMNVAPEVLWASSIIDARLEADLQKWEQLYESAPDEDFSDYVMAVLNCVVGTIRNTSRGFARRQGSWL